MTRLTEESLSDHTIYKEVLDSDEWKEDVRRAQEWKETSFNEITEAYREKDVDKMVSALHKCASNSGVVRTVPTEGKVTGSWHNLAQFIIESYDDISNGKFDFTDNMVSNKIRRGFGFNRYPRSFMSKLCHIINPFDYPMIWDSYVRNYIGLHYMELIGMRDFFLRCEECNLIPFDVDSGMEEAWLQDSEIWAYIGICMRLRKEGKI